MTTRLTATPWGTFISVEVSSAEPDDDPVWVDISQWVIVPGGATLEAWLGRATELSRPEDGHGSWLLDNRDERFTPGNPSSPYYPWWKQARRVRVRETVGYQAFDLADGYLEIPETIIRTQPADGTSPDIELAVAFVDIMGRLSDAQEFPSNVGAHVVSAGSALRTYWSMGGTGPVAYSDAPVRQPSLRAGAFTPGDATAKQDEAFLWSNATAPGDDLAVPTWVSSGTTNLSNLELSADFDTPVTAAAGQVVTVAAWLKVGLISASALSLTSTIAFVAEDGGSLSQIVLQVTRDASGALFINPLFAISDGVHTLSLDWTGQSVPMPIDAWRLVSLQVALSTATDAQRLCVGTATYTATAVGTVPTAIQLDGISRIGQHLSGSVGHMQIHVTDTADLYDHAGQRAMGMYGLEWQTTGQRVNSILDYAGFPAGRRDIDPGIAVMSRANLAGARPADALERARETEQGRLLADGGRIQFHGRPRIYDI